MLLPVSSQMATRKVKCVLVFMGAKSYWTGPRPALFIPHVVASRSLPRLLRALPAQPSREAARWGRWAIRPRSEMSALPVDHIQVGARPVATLLTSQGSRPAWTSFGLPQPIVIAPIGSGTAMKYKDCLLAKPGRAASG